MAKSTGWVPQQHGAWAMIVVPYITGLVLAGRVRPLGPGDLFLGLTWLVGYFAFNATVLTLKSPPARRRRYRAPLAAYLAGAGVFGLATLYFQGWFLLTWVPAYAVVLGISLWLAASKRERTILSGVLTILASCGLMAVLRITPGTPAPTASEVATMLAVALYFIGTVFHVKALIRERNDPASATRSLIFHAVFAAVVAVAVGFGWLSWPWMAWALALVARSWWLPRGRRTPMQIGLVEIAFSAAVLLLVVFA